MEKKIKDQKPRSACNQESQTNEPQNMQDEAQPNVSFPSHDRPPNSSQQQQPSIVQWSHTPQNASQQFLAASIPTQAPSPGAFNQWQQLPHPQQGQVFAQPTSPFWQPQPSAAGGPLLGANIPASFPTFTENGWQVHPVVPGGTSSTTQVPIPSMCYHVGYTFPGFPGSWDPSSCLSQMHQLQHPYVHNFPGALGFPTATPNTMTGCSGEHSFQRGIIRLPEKLSQKHQKLWEAQSVENVQLRSLINKLQAEVSDYKDRLKKLEEEVLSLRHKMEELTKEPTNEAVGTIPVGTGQPPKRGRPKRSSASIGALHESQPRAQGRKPTLTKAQFESKSPIFEKVILKKVENKGIASPYTTTMAQQEINEKILNAVSNVSGNFQVDQNNSMMSAYQGQLHQEYRGKVNFEKNRDKNLKLAYSELSQPDKVLNNMGVSAKFIENTGNGNLGWTSGIPSQHSGRDELDLAHQSFFQQAGNMTSELNFANEEDDASEELENAIIGSAKDENEEEMGDETSSAAKEIGVTKDVGGCIMNNAIATIPKGLSPL